MEDNMALRYIIEKGDPQLNKKSRPVTEFNDRLHILLDDMRETLKGANGYGLAAPQVGVLRQVVLVVDTSDTMKTQDEQIIELVNPVITEMRDEQEGPEGCLSVPGIYGIVKRPRYVEVRAQDRNGNDITVSGQGITARCFCHEIDHLQGRLFTEIAERILTDEELEMLATEEGNNV
jgi:peptide deformylase